MCFSTIKRDLAGALVESFADSWPTLVCGGLNASCHAAAWSGYGMAMNCCGGNTLMSDVWNRTLASVGSDDPSDPHGTALPWDFARWTPDAVVINLGTNDNLEGRPYIVSPYNETYVDLVIAASANYGLDTHFFLACGPMDNSYCDAVEWVIAEVAQHDVKASLLDQRGFLNGDYGEDCCGHPSASIDDAMATGAIETIRATLGW